MLNLLDATISRRVAGLARCVLVAVAGASSVGAVSAQVAATAGTSALTPQPYGADFPRPSFAATERKQSQFAVEYVFRYFESEYKPAAPIHAIPRPGAMMDTPEHTLIAQVSAAMALDYDWWVSLWDTRSQQMFHDDVTSMKHDAAFWKNLWQKGLQGREVTLVKRLETGQYVVLEYRVGRPAAPGVQDALYHAVLRPEGPKWVLTRALDDSGFFQTALLGVPAGAPQQAEFAPTPSYSGHEKTSFTEPQQLFLRDEPRGAQSATKVVW